MPLDVEEKANRMIDQILDLGKSLDDLTARMGCAWKIALSGLTKKTLHKQFQKMQISWNLHCFCGKIVRLSVLCKINWAYPRFHFCLQFFRSVDLNTVTDRCLSGLTLNLNYMSAWSLLIYFGLFGRILRNNMCQEVRTQSIETVKFRFSCVFLGVTFLKLVYFFQSSN